MLLFLLLCLPAIVLMVKQEDFKTCSQSSFCLRQRAYAKYASLDSEWKAPYQLVRESLRMNSVDGRLDADLLNTAANVTLTLEIKFMEIGAIRVQINEKSPLKPRYTGASEFSVEAGLNTAPFTIKKEEETQLLIEFKGYTIQLGGKPFKFEVYNGNDSVFRFNHRGFFHFEHLRVREALSETVNEAMKEPLEPLGDAPLPGLKDELLGDAPLPGSTQETVAKLTKESKTERELALEQMRSEMWDESFNQKPDSKPNGPSSIGIDFQFSGFKHAFGLPEHGSDFALHSTRGPNAKYTEPYRLYNLDVFEYILDSPMALYGSIPYVTAHRPGQTVGLLWVNSAEMWVDIEKSSKRDEIQTKNNQSNKRNTIDFHWSAESGILDAFVLLGENPHQVQTQLAAISGKPAMPQLFSVAYHQCRWNYNDEDDVASVDAGYDEHQIPYDVLWLDIEHTDGKRYFTWDKNKFPTPERMQQSLAAKKRRMVTIIDPHIKIDSNFELSSQAQKQDLLVKDKNGKDYTGWCWPGNSNWIDYTNPLAREYWAKQFLFDSYKGSTPSLYTWNDMNEPSVFTGPEITMHKDNLHSEGWEHRDIHNLYGLLQQRATYEGHLLRSSHKDRPFVLSRAFFIGTQRYGPIWTGDNFATWDHLAASVPMLLSCGIAGMPFIGADVGGFFGNPEPELLVRWYQVGAFQPFFRAHAHIDTKRREPWLFGDDVTALIKDAIIQRYKILPYIYTLNFEANQTGSPILRPMYYEFPADSQSVAVEDQFMLGSAILVKPVSKPNCKSLNVYLPLSNTWYNYYSLNPVDVSSDGLVGVKTPQNRIAVFYRGGSIVGRKERVRRSSELMKNDPFTLVVALDHQETASGALYVDDGQTFEHQHGKFIWTKLNFSEQLLTGQPSAVQGWTGSLDAHDFDVRVERIILLGSKRAITRAIVKDGSKTVKECLVFSEKLKNGSYRVTVKDPAVLIGSKWTVSFE